MRKNWCKAIFKFASLVLLMVLTNYSIIANAEEKEFSEDVFILCDENSNINYDYARDEYGNYRPVGFHYEGQYFEYEYDDRGIIISIHDVNKQPVAYYDCTDTGYILGVYDTDDEERQENFDSNFVGNINKIRWLGFEYDESTGHYQIYGREYDPVEQIYIDGVSKNSIFSEVNPYEFISGSIASLNNSYDDEDLAAEEWADDLLASDSYGLPISYSSGWYNNLSTVELLARCIYAEGGTAYTSEENAVAWVILNRYHNSEFPGTVRGVITASGQFSSVTGNSSSYTENARIPATSSTRWSNSTYLACLMLTTTNVNAWVSIIGSPLNGQLFFYSYTYAKNNNGHPFSGTNADSLYCDSTHIYNVYVIGYGYVSSFTTLFNDYNPTQYSRNIFYSSY